MYLLSISIQSTLLLPIKLSKAEQRRVSSVEILNTARSGSECKTKGAYRNMASINVKNMHTWLGHERKVTKLWECGIRDNRRVYRKGGRVRAER